MASLTHVCMWQGKGWKRITAQEAAALHPGGTVSAHSGLFMCEICGQYVLLTDSTVQKRHFRHSSAEKSKDCPERTFGSSVSVTYNQGEHDLPIRIVRITKDNFELEMGLIRVPQNFLSRHMKIDIRPQSFGQKSFVYLYERINPDGISYVPIGNIPSEKYALTVSGTDNGIYNFWPRMVSGIDPNGTIFDATTGKRLVYDSDVAVGKKYYLLKRGSYISKNPHITLREICTKIISWERWTLFEVTANDYDERSARFFLDYHCRLTEIPIAIQTVWPVFVESPYVIKHNKKSVVINVRGNAPTTQVFPSAGIKKYAIKNSTLLEINCNNRQQLISAGRTRALQYTYFWQEPLEQVTEEQDAIVTDIYQNPILPGVHHELIEKKIIRINIPYDGTLVVSVKDEIVEKHKLRSRTTFEIDNIGWNYHLEVYVGYDCIWEISFERVIVRESMDESAVLMKLQSLKGKQVQLPHTAGALANRLSQYPRIKQWLYVCIRRGTISAQAYKELQLLVNRGKETIAVKKGEE